MASLWARDLVDQILRGFGVFIVNFIVWSVFSDMIIRIWHDRVAGVDILHLARDTISNVKGLTMRESLSSGAVLSSL